MVNEPEFTDIEVNAGVEALADRGYFCHGDRLDVVRTVLKAALPVHENRQLLRFKRRVADEAINQKEQNSWCDGDFAEVMEDLDLTELVFGSEPATGSVVLDEDEGIAYIRSANGIWHATTGGEYTWPEIVKNVETVFEGRG